MPGLSPTWDQPLACCPQKSEQASTWQGVGSPAGAAGPNAEPMAKLEPRATGSLQICPEEGGS